METTERRFNRWLPVALLILCASWLPRPLTAQGNLNALDIDPAIGAPFGYNNQGVGWSFVPTADLLVTGISSTAPQVDFWLGTNQNIATYNYAGPYGRYQSIRSIGGAPTNFQTIEPLLLFAGQTYFISTQQTNFSSSIGLYVYSLNGANSLSFIPSPYISQFGSYYLSTNGEWSATTSPASENVNYAFLGPNFQFQVVPEPTSLALIIAAAGVWLVSRRTLAKCLHDRATH